MRACRACQQEKALDQFNKQSHNSGRRTMCRPCERLQRKATQRRRGYETPAGFTKAERARWTRNLNATIGRIRAKAQRVIA